jgi:hypothetical protein
MEIRYIAVEREHCFGKGFGPKTTNIKGATFIIDS